MHSKHWRGVWGKTAPNGKLDMHFHSAGLFFKPIINTPIVTNPAQLICNHAARKIGGKVAMRMNSSVIGVTVICVSAASAQASLKKIAFSEKPVAAINTNAAPTKSTAA